MRAQDGVSAKMTSKNVRRRRHGGPIAYGSCEALYKPDLEEEELVEAACGAMAAGLDVHRLAAATSPSTSFPRRRGARTGG